MVRISCPLAVPGILSAGIFAFTRSWNEFRYSLVLLGLKVHCIVCETPWRGDVSFALSRAYPLAIRARARYTSPQAETSHAPRPGKAHAQLVTASELR